MTPLRKVIRNLEYKRCQSGYDDAELGRTRCHQQSETWEERNLCRERSNHNKWFHRPTKDAIDDKRHWRPSKLQISFPNAHPTASQVLSFPYSSLDSHHAPLTKVCCSAHPAHWSGAERRTWSIGSQAAPPFDIERGQYCGLRTSECPQVWIRTCCWHIFARVMPVDLAMMM